MNYFDQQIAAWFLLHRTGAGINIFSVITFFGDWRLLLPAMFAILYILYRKNKKKFIRPFALTVIGAEAVTLLGKILIHRPRPLAGVFQEADFSFPSGHATIAAALYGYLAYILIKSLKNKYKWSVIILAIALILLIGFSRIYLGVHYVSDVLGGYFVGLTALAVGINFYKIFPKK